MRICIFFWIYGFDFLEVSMLIMLEFFVLRLILSGLINWVCFRFCAVIFSSFFRYYSPKPLHEPSGRNHGLDLQRRSPLSPSVADLHHHPALYPSLLCAKRPICAGGSSNHCRSSVGMFLDFFFFFMGLRWERWKKKKKRSDACSEEQRKKSLFLEFFYGSEMRQVRRKKERKKERMNKLRMCLAKRAGAKGGLVWLCSNCGTHVVGLIIEMPLKIELWKLKTHKMCFQFP